MRRAEIEKKIVAILRNNDARQIKIFGSFARGEERPDSDIDLIVTFNKRKSLLNLIRIERELSESVGMKIDLLTEEALSPYLADKINSEVRVLYQ